MPVKSWTPGKEVLNPRGFWSATAQKRKGNPERASYMQNMRVSPGVVGPRPGTSNVPGFPATAGLVSCLFNWTTQTNSNLVLYQDATTVKSFDQGTLANPTLLADTLMARAASFSDFDIWTYFCGYDVQAAGVYQVEIFDGINTDKAFRGPITLISATATDGGAGQCTIGTHYLGVVYQNRTGYSGVPTTTVASVPIAITLGADGRLINLAVSLPALPDGGGNSTLFLVMTRADNPANWYFIPTDAQTGSIGEQPVPFNTPVTLNFVASLSDEDIAASADSANSQFLLLTQAPDGTGPFNPSYVGAYGERMYYGVGPVLYISDINNPQSITGDQNEVSMPNKRNIGYAFPLPGSTSLYLTGDRWTAYVTDNSDVPGTWPQPILVSGALGTDFPNCVCYRTAGNYAWVVTEVGPYSFNGIYDERPLTFLVSDNWKRINWKSRYAIQVADDVLNLKLYIGVPLDGSTECNYMFVFDYQNTPTGATPAFDTVDISLDVYSPVLFGSLAIVKEAASGLSNLWIGPDTAGNVNRLDDTTKNDNGVAVDRVWESGLIRGSDVSRSMIRCGPADLWARGNGTLNTTLFGPDHQQSVILPLLLGAGIPAPGLTPQPGQMYAFKGDMSKVENFTFQFRTNTVDSWFELSMLRAYLRADIANR